MLLYVLSGLIAGLAGILLAGVTKTATLSVADAYLLPSVAAAVIGGASIFGGRSRSPAPSWGRSSCACCWGSWAP